MQQVLSSEELSIHLNNFRKTLQSFDYSDIKNVRFLNLESVCAYIDSVPDNPFKRQYKQLQQALDIIQPYLPFLSSERAQRFLIDMSKLETDTDVENLKKVYTDKLRTDFINITRVIKNDNEWNDIINTFEEIRTRKEHSYMH